MSLSLSMSGFLLVQQTLAAQDTLIMKTVPVHQSWFQQVTGAASGIMTLTLLVLTFALVPAAWNFRKSYARLNTLLDRVFNDVPKLVHNAQTIAENVNHVTTAIRTDVEAVRETIALANTRLRAAVLTTESRIEEFNALLAVMQQEAEAAFVETAATVRGMRTGAQVLQDEVVGRDALVADADDALDIEQALDAEELHGLDADDDEALPIDLEGDDGDDDHEPPAPRIRRRPPRHG